MFRVLNGFLLIFFPLLALALQSDAEQMLHIMANASSFDYKTGKNIYEGDVKIDQGTTHLTADKLVTENNAQHRIKTAIASGMQKLAKYTTETKVGDPPLHAQAKVIKFYPAKSLVILEGEVTVTQGENSFNGPLIIYNTKDQTVVAPPSKLGQSTIVIEAKQML